ncbi:FAD-binding protein [Pseudodesulfovibrio sp. JC047]|uniref:NAD(P)/FAD-dependent oxidoreductase n=1 Tax=Pseudodesulfovibrio sp. JC047 TaxID=2683199 RepID=UPI0013D738ED|nr:NAD(P)/FAD-dependent oxidoreductase [Pseudodesulfovibrio sp. JC047]NDV19482.1 FAD-binding protein [Pseudodesulfovibrio sp. JC047]
MHNVWDVIIVGAGPAGMCAALETTGHGLRTLVLDRQMEPGGQIYRSVGSSAMVDKLGSDYAAGLPLVKKFNASDAQFESGANVWDIAPDRVYYSRQGKSYCEQARHVILATGAMERPVPLPGWTLPGVMGSGASDVLLKSSSLLPEGPVVLCGNGPLILQAAVHLSQFDIPVAGVLLTGRLGNALRATKYALGACSRPGYFLHGVNLAIQTLFKHKCVFEAQDIRISEKGQGLEVLFATRSGKKKELTASTVLLHEGVISESRITRLARCRHTWDQCQRYWHVDADLWGQTSVPGLRTAGDTASVRGAVAAQAEGHLVGLDVCRELGSIPMSQRDDEARPHLRIIKRCKSLQPFLDEYFAPTPSMLQPAADAIVCRCEELTAGELREAINEGCYSPNGLKSQARPGMGTCQGRVCGQAVAEMIADAHGIPLENLPLYTAQPPLFPLRLGELVNTSIPPDLL